MSRDPWMERLPAVDALRAFCILAVMGHHFLGLYSEPSSEGFSLLESVFRNGSFGVTGFFVVSGFLITRLLGSSDRLMPLKEFYVRRIARLLPLLGLTVGLGLALHTFLPPDIPGGTFCLFGRDWPLTPGYLASVATFTTNWCLLLDPFAWRPVFWGSLWSLAVEEQFYLAYPFFHHRLLGRSIFDLVLGILIIGGVGFRTWAFFVHPQNALLSYTSTFSALDALALGALTFVLWERLRPNLERQTLQSCILALLGFALAARAYITTSRAPDRILGPFLLSLGCSLFLLGACSLPERWFKPARIWVDFGSMSYGLYLLHIFILLGCWRGLAHLPPIPAFLLFTLLSALAAWTSQRFFEKPANRWIRHRFGLSTKENLLKPHLRADDSVSQ